jgi:hypothetical protein
MFDVDEVNDNNKINVFALILNQSQMNLRTNTSVFLPDLKSHQKGFLALLIASGENGHTLNGVSVLLVVECRELINVKHLAWMGQIDV